MPRRRFAMISLSLLLVLSMMVSVRSTVAQDEDPIVIGAAVHQSGWMAAYDLPPLEGAQLAVEKINEAGGVLGRPLQIIERDGKTDPADGR